ncbi:MAG: hypothetical protein Q7K26_03595 [bacterium]|nr:hypothetical protein [bacterium]
MISSRVRFLCRAILSLGVLVALGALAWDFNIVTKLQHQLTLEIYPFIAGLIFIPFYALYITIRTYYSDEKPIQYLLTKSFVVGVILLALALFSALSPGRKEINQFELQLGIMAGILLVFIIPIILGGIIIFLRKRFRRTDNSNNS